MAATGERFVSILMDQLNGVGEQFKMILTRSDMAPYYRWQPTNTEIDENTEDKEKSKTKSPPLADEKIPLDELNVRNFGTTIVSRRPNTKTSTLLPDNCLCPHMEDFMPIFRDPCRTVINQFSISRGIFTPTRKKEF